jgi:hypothetical protein
MTSCALLKGTDTGAQTSAKVEQLMAQAQAALRDGRPKPTHHAGPDG